MMVMMLPVMRMKMEDDDDDAAAGVDYNNEMMTTAMLMMTTVMRPSRGNTLGSSPSRERRIGGFSHRVQRVRTTEGLFRGTGSNQK